MSCNAYAKAFFKGSTLSLGLAVTLSFTWASFSYAQNKAVLVQTIDTSTLDPPSPDPAGITYLVDSDTLLFSDSEVNEMSIFRGVNLWEIGSDGGIITTTTTLGFSNEPTGVAYNSWNGHVFISDDDRKEIYEVEAGPDTLYGTVDDTVTSFDTLAFNSVDPEGVTVDNWAGVLFIVDGVNSQVYRVHPGANGVFDGVAPVGDDLVTDFDIAIYGMSQPRGIAFNTDNGNLYVIGTPASLLVEVTTAGAFVRQVDISAANAKNPVGLAYAPGSLDPSMMNVYIAARGIDNNTDPNENDGKLYEMILDPSSLADLSMIKSVDNPAPIVGSDVVFTLTASNGGPDDASGIEVTDQLPSGYTYVSHNGRGAYDALTGLWTIGDLTNGSSATLNITATVNPSGDFTNTAQISASSEPDPDRTNDQSSASTTPVAFADLVMRKLVDNPAPSVGSDLQFTLRVRNLGPFDASGVEVTDLLPSGYTYVSDDGLGAYDPTSGLWRIGVLTNGSLARLRITATVNPSGEFTNIARISALNETDPNPANNEASISTAPDPPPLCTTVTHNLSAETVTTTVNVVGCSITAGNGYTIASGGNVTFSAKTYVALTDGFSVLTGGIFVAAIDPTIP